MRLPLSFKIGFCGLNGLFASFVAPELLLQARMDGWQKKNLLIAHKNLKTRPTPCGIPRGSPIQVLTLHDRAQLQ